MEKRIRGRGERQGRARGALLCMLVLAMLAGVLGGCGADREQDAGAQGAADYADLPVLTLALRAGIYSEIIKECIPAFEAENGVHCEILELGEDELHSLVAADAENAEGKYDLCMVDGSWMAEYTAKEVLANLSGLGYALDDDIIPATTAICYRDGQVYLAPFYGNVTVLLYNKYRISSAGYDADEMDSLADILAVCRQVQESGDLGFVYRGDTENNLVVDFLPILLSFGGWVVDGEMRPAVDTAEFKEALEFYLELIGTGGAAERDDLILAVANGAAAMGIGWPGWYTPAEDSSADYCAISGKVRDGSEAFNANVYGVWAIGIPANSTRKELAKKLLEYLMDPEVQKSTVPSGGVPCRYSSLRDEEVLAQFPQYGIVCDALEGGVYRPVMEEWQEFYTILGAEMDRILRGEKSVDAGLSDAQRALEELLE